MCTLTLVPRSDGYVLAMNRDEKITRDPGSIPEGHEFGGTRVLCPGDGAGGTWIATNEHGIAMALLNWNVPLASPDVARQWLSRGQLIPALAHARLRHPSRSTCNRPAVA